MPRARCGRCPHEVHQWATVRIFLESRFWFPVRAEGHLYLPERTANVLLGSSSTVGVPQRLGAVLGDVIQKLGVERKLDEARAIEAWGEVSSTPIQRVTSETWMRDGILHVRISSAVWRQELHLQREAWRDRINRHVGRNVVREIRFS